MITGEYGNGGVFIANTISRRYNGILLPKLHTTRERTTSEVPVRTTWCMGSPVVVDLSSNTDKFEGENPNCHHVTPIHLTTLTLHLKMKRNITNTTQHVMTDCYCPVDSGNRSTYLVTDADRDGFLPFFNSLVFFVVRHGDR